jgi:hypothetical protein
MTCVFENQFHRFGFPGPGSAQLSRIRKSMAGYLTALQTYGVYKGPLDLPKLHLFV